MGGSWGFGGSGGVVVVVVGSDLVGVSCGFCVCVLIVGDFFKGYFDVLHVLFLCVILKNRTYDVWCNDKYYCKIEKVVFGIVKWHCERTKKGEGRAFKAFSSFLACHIGSMVT